jgi:hypothetical protein
MLKCWSCSGSGATNVNSSGWGRRCDSCGGTGNAGAIQLLLMLVCSVFGCLLAPIGTMAPLAEAKAFGYVPAWLAWPLAVAILVLWYLFYFRAGLWKQFSTASRLGSLWLVALIVVVSKTQVPRPIVAPEPVVAQGSVVAPGPTVGSGADGQIQRPVTEMIPVSIHAQLGPAQTGEEVTLRIDAITKQWTMTNVVRSQDVVVDLPAAGNYNYQLTSITTVIIKGKGVTLAGRGEGTILVRSGAKFVYVIHDAQGIAPLHCELRSVP